ncbi:MAG: hypothetical protein ABMB14_05905 [Myxococcota bacterium]
MNRMMAFVVVSTLVGCGGAGKKNVTACEDYVASLACGDFDVTSLYGDDFCSAYEETTCDISEYFNCLTDSVACDDATSVLTVDAAGCASKAVCE